MISLETNATISEMMSINFKNEEHKFHHDCQLCVTRTLLKIFRLKHGFWLGSDLIDSYLSYGYSCILEFANIINWSPWSR
mmetsp:Transcript_5469/g.7893  ORF Transcript_5469/g.7893 Transcript_5469/m.7893 type:complete len:80 (+) Transcript_5469:1430-1669(+)